MIDDFERTVRLLDCDIAAAKERVRPSADPAPIRYGRRHCANSVRIR